MDNLVEDALSDATWIFLMTIIPPLVSGSIALVRWIIPAFVGLLKSKLSEKQFQELSVAARVAVRYAEQVAASESMKKVAGYKYALAESAVNTFLRKRKLKFTAADVRVAIESAVHEELNKNKVDPADVVVVAPAPTPAPVPVEITVNGVPAKEVGLTAPDAVVTTTTTSVAHSSTSNGG